MFELSSHQLEYTAASPHVAVMLNFFQEHLDAYPSYEAYQQSKLNIARFQGKEDFLIYHSGDELLSSHVNVLGSKAHGFPFSLSVQNRPGIFRHQNEIFFSDGLNERAIWKTEQKRYL